jgi:hypothetical protein
LHRRVHAGSSKVETSLNKVETSLNIDGQPALAARSLFGLWGVLRRLTNQQLQLPIENGD